MRQSSISLFSLVVFACLLCACSTAPKTQSDRDALKARADQTIQRFKQEDASMAKLFQSAEGFAVFPSVGKGGAGLGGAYGRGILYQNGSMVGYCDLSQGSIGFQLGGQSYAEVIFFESNGSLSSFKAGTFEFAAQASAVAVTAGASADADYEDGVLVFTMPNGGLMFEASIGGQKFSYQPK